MLPGETAFSKTAYATIGTGLGAFLIAKGIYIPNDETLVLLAFAITVRALYTKLSGPVSEYLENSIKVTENMMLISIVYACYYKLFINYFFDLFLGNS